MKKHGERSHSKFSASGAERWLACPGSVAISEGLPDKDSVWSIEGTKAHETLETIMKAAIETGATAISHVRFAPSVPREMQAHTLRSANWLLKLHARHPFAELLIENRVYLSFIHPEMFGTYDGAVLDHFGTLHVYDFKYGAGHAVSPTGNLQMIFYGIGLAHAYGWNFKRVRLWIDQPRIRGYDGPMFWEITIEELQGWVRTFERGVKRALNNPDEFVEGGHCHWCKAKSVCPLKREGRQKKAFAVFTAAPVYKANRK